jgi:hypothetical protein
VERDSASVLLILQNQVADELHEISLPGGSELNLNG